MALEQRISSRAVIGMFYRILSQITGQSWVNAISMYIPSDQDEEEYAWLGQSPQMQEWVGKRQAKGLREDGQTVKNKHFEATLDILVRHLRRDKTGQVRIRIAELARRGLSHWAKLLSTLIIDGETGVCYDGQYFFDTDHLEDDSGTQDNDITTDISELPVEVAGTTTNPSPQEMAQAIIKSIVQMQGFVDDVGEPMNEDASNFLVMVPLPYYQPAINGLAMPAHTGEGVQRPRNINIEVVSNARLSAWTDKFVTFRTDGDVKPFIRQEETGIVMKAKAENSEYEFDTDAHQYGIDSWREVAYGYWQHAVLNQLT